MLFGVIFSSEDVITQKSNLLHLAIFTIFFEIAQNDKKAIRNPLSEYRKALQFKLT